MVFVTCNYNSYERVTTIKSTMQNELMCDRLYKSDDNNVSSIYKNVHNIDALTVQQYIQYQ